jgi:RimJ/RimL family protein N-acetyltransferase
MEVMRGRRSFLRPVDPADYPFLYQLEMTGDLAYRWRHRGITPSPEAAMRSVWEGAIAVLLACSIEKGAPYGLVVAYNSQFPGATAFVASAALPEMRRTGVVIEASALFIQYCFDNWGFRKLYAEVTEFNLNQFSGGLSKIFKEEARLRQHDYWRGQFWDRYTFALYREDWDEHVRKMPLFQRDVEQPSAG